MNTGLNTLHPYPFEKLGQLFEGLSPPDQLIIPLTTGEPQHAPPEKVTELLREQAALVAAKEGHEQTEEVLKACERLLSSEL